MIRILTLLVLATCLLSSCWTAHPMSWNKTTSLKVEVICVGPGENGLCIYSLKGLKGSGLKGRFYIIDSNDKYLLETRFKLLLLKTEQL